jgi:predicted membrane protein
MDYTNNEKISNKPYCSKPDGVPFIGIFLIGLGLVFLFDRIGIIPEYWRNIIISWQMLLIFIGSINLFRNHARFPGVILILVGLAFLLPEIIQIPFETRQLIWPLVLILIGVFIVFKRKNVKKAHYFNLQTENVYSDDLIDETAIFGGGKRVVSSQNLKGGNITAIFGGVELDLSDADLSEDGAIIELACIFGGTTIIVKPEWEVQVQVTSIMGGFTDKRKVYKQTGSVASKRLVIKGAAIFGGGEIKSF